MIAQLRETLPNTWKCSLHAVDGSVTKQVKHQAGWLGSDVTHLVVSVGGNDALGHAHIMMERASSYAEVLNRFATLRDRFADDYREMLKSVLSKSLPTALCTIYDVQYTDPNQTRLANVALTIFNDVITRAAFANGLTLIDLRLICNEVGDLANPIEPSVKGGAKIARAIAEFCTTKPPADGKSVVLAG